MRRPNWLKWPEFLKPKVITDISRTKAYLLRWNLHLPFGLGTIKLHQILRPDTDRCPHNHPWWFVRVILWGGYEEVYGPDNRHQVLKPWRPWAPWRIYYCPIDFRHRITRLLNGRVSWSLVLTGPKKQDWGFFTRMGWMEWESFVNQMLVDRVAWCEDGKSVVPETELSPFEAAVAGKGEGRTILERYLHNLQAFEQKASDEASHA